VRERYRLNHGTRSITDLFRTRIRLAPLSDVLSNRQRSMQSYPENKIGRHFSIEPFVDFDLIAPAHVPDLAFDLFGIHIARRISSDLIARTHTLLEKSRLLLHSSMRSAPGAATYIPISPDPGILGRLEPGSSGGNRKPAHEQSKEDNTTSIIPAKNSFACFMNIIRCESSFGCG
jgi:hypothetical protein